MRMSRTSPVKIIVIGAGGTGGYVIPHLYRLSYALRRDIRVIICDGDLVEEKNLIRQNFIAQDIGRNKAQVQAERYSAAFGIECEYIPRYVESVEQLMGLVSPDFYKDYQHIETQDVILLGCVDNNNSRQICHKVFGKQKDIVYIDSGNGEHTGQVVCGVRQKGKTVYKSVCTKYPDIRKKTDKLPSELSCAERSVSAPQSVTANLMAATAVVSFLYDLLVCGELKTESVTFSSRQINMRPEFEEPPKPKAKTKPKTKAAKTAKRKE